MHMTPGPATAAESKPRYGITVLRTVVNGAPGQLRAIHPRSLEAPPVAGRWSKKEELGHLIDTAAHCHLRLIRAQLTDHPVFSGDYGDSWVRLHDYAQRDWGELVAVWQAYNLQALAVMGAMPAEAWQRCCTIGAAAPITLAALLTRYVEHTVHHLRRLGVDTGVLFTGTL